MPVLMALRTLGRRLPSWAIPLILAVLLLATGGAAWKVWLYFHDRHVIGAYEDGIENRIEIGAGKADEKMAERAKRDAAAEDEARRIFNNASIDLPRSGLTDRQRLDACNELRAQATPPAVLAAAGCVRSGTATEARSGGGDRK